MGMTKGTPASSQIIALEKMLEQQRERADSLAVEAAGISRACKAATDMQIEAQRKNRALLAQVEAMREALEEIASSPGCQTPGCSPANPSCDTNMAKAALTAPAAEAGADKPTDEMIDAAIPVLGGGHINREIVRDVYKAMRRAAPAKGAQVVPGWKLVPVEPTRQMWTAGGDTIVVLQSAGVTHHDKLVGCVWEAMLAAAPAKREDDECGGPGEEDGSWAEGWDERSRPGPEISAPDNLPLMARREWMPQWQKLFIAWDEDGQCRIYDARPSLSIPPGPVWSGYRCARPEYAVTKWNSHWAGNWRKSLHRIADTDEHGLPVVPWEEGMPDNKYRWQSLIYPRGWNYCDGYGLDHGTEQWQRIEDYRPTKGRSKG